MNRPWTQIALIAVLALAGCSNPAADKPEAVVSEAKPVAEDTAVTPSGTETAGATTPTEAEPVAVLEIGPETSSIGFVGSKVTGSHNGGFKKFTGEVALSPDGDAIRRITAEIDMNSTWTDNEKLTGHLKTPDFFDVAKYPTATFVTTEIAPDGADGATHTVTGNLTLHGVTKSITFPATIQVTDTEATVDSEFVIRRMDFGIEYSGQADNLIRDEVVLKLKVRAPKDGGESAAQESATPAA